MAGSVAGGGGPSSGTGFAGILSLIIIIIGSVILDKKLKGQMELKK